VGSLSSRPIPSGSTSKEAAKAACKQARDSVKNQVKPILVNAQAERKQILEDMKKALAALKAGG
jgi:hypothetical protein